MQIAALFSLLLAPFFPALAANPGGPRICPDFAQGETAEDCPWAEIARAWPVDLKTVVPSLYQQIHTDSKNEVFKRLWGKSSNFDELAHGTVVNPEIMRTLSKMMKVPEPSSDGMIQFAGLEHTYGYLFSILKTSFGYKRQRWVRGEIEKGFGLPVGVLGPLAPNSGGGTLFSNATYFFGKIAFRDSSDLLDDLEKNSAGVASAIRDFDFGALAPIRLEEIIPAERVLIHTDLIPFTSDPTQELLVYSIVKNGKAQLITGFPITKQFADKLVDPDGLGDDRPIVTRYNAYVEGISGKKFTGTRRVVKVQYINRRKRDGRAHH